MLCFNLNNITHLLYRRLKLPKITNNPKDYAVPTIGLSVCDFVWTKLTRIDGKLLFSKCLRGWFQFHCISCVLLWCEMKSPLVNVIIYIRLHCDKKCTYLFKSAAHTKHNKINSPRPRPEFFSSINGDRSFMFVNMGMFSLISLSLSLSTCELQLSSLLVLLLNDERWTTERHLFKFTDLFSYLVYYPLPIERHLIIFLTFPSSRPLNWLLGLTQSNRSIAG